MSASTTARATSNGTKSASPVSVDAAAQASIGAAARELHLPTVRTEAVRLADIALRERQSHLRVGELVGSPTVVDLGA